jgi:4-amino-4-deoxychorismate lyase
MGCPGVRGEVIWSEGHAGGSVSALDRGLHYGEGLFETIACLERRPRFLALHLERLALGCARLGLPAPAAGRLRERIEQAAAAQPRAIIKVLLTRGPGESRGYRWGREAGTCVIMRFPWPDADAAQRRAGARVRIASTRLGENPALAGMKHCNRLEQVLAANEPGGAEADEALMLSTSGRLICGTMTNVFLIDGEASAVRVRTPAIRTCGVAGVMRRVVMREAARAGLAVEECAMRLEDLSAAREVFLTNARVGLWPVRSLPGRELVPGALTARLAALVRPLLEAPADG